MAQTALEYVKTYAASFTALFGTPNPHGWDERGTSIASSEPTNVVYLKPARRSGARLILVPLLPPPKPKADLPAELWRRCIRFAMNLDPEKHKTNSQEFSRLLRCRKELLLVSKKFKEAAAPVLYEEIKIYKLSALESLRHAVVAGDQRWDNLRRIPHSTPGRWILSLDISTISNDFTSRSMKLKADTYLSEILALTPFLTTFHSDPKFVLSGRALRSLGGELHGSSKLRSIKGLLPPEDSLSIPASWSLLARDSLVGLVRGCSRTLESLEIIGTGASQDEDEIAALIIQHSLSFPSLTLPKLHTLSLVGMPSSPLFYALTSSSLPSLARLTLTIYPSRHSREKQSPSAAFLAAHSGTITSLILPTPPDWPPPDYVGSSTSLPTQGSPMYLSHSILHLLPRLTRLNLSFPLPPLLLIPKPDSELTTLIFPRPIAALLPFVLDMLQGDASKNVGASRFGSRPIVRPGELPGLRKIVWTKAKWLRSDVGASSRFARTAGDQGEMLRWKRTLARFGVQLIDADGRSI
ncbi:hypothetical protein DL93DRAFT_97528 [Clavulina sp. PMI_390]|nr:hypothetical protein DL93DRAFT_97528 [Clavulina sp. PMI_390]